MNVAIASDHRGFQLKAKVVAALMEAGHTVEDLGTDSIDSVDYPDYGAKVGALISEGRVERGILICGTGIGMCIVANKYAGVRAACCHDDLTAEMSRRHNDCNVLCVSADLLGDRLVTRMVDIWLNTEFEGGRHARRVEKIAKLEEGRKPAASEKPGNDSVSLQSLTSAAERRQRVALGVSPRSTRLGAQAPNGATGTWNASVTLFEAAFPLLCQSRGSQQCRSAAAPRLNRHD